MLRSLLFPAPVTMSAELQWAVIRKSSAFLRTNKVGGRDVLSTVRPRAGARGAAGGGAAGGGFAPAAIFF